MKYGIEISDIDKYMSKRVVEVYSDPARHKFYSEHQAFLDEPEYWCGPRGGKIIGRKRKCFHCGQKEAGHSKETENL